jgi:cyclic beta-1,2-glucan synthetase
LRLTAQRSRTSPARSQAAATTPGDLLFWADATHRSIESWRRDVIHAHDDANLLKLRERLLAVATAATEMATLMEFGFLFDSQRRLLSIGYRAADGTLDPSCYDLLASEARLASFIAIAKGDVVTRHCFAWAGRSRPSGMAQR